MNQKRMPSTRINFRVEQEVRQGQDFLRITVWSNRVVKKNWKLPNDLDNFREALIDGSRKCNEGDMHIANCVQAILAAYPSKPMIGEVFFSKGFEEDPHVYVNPTQTFIIKVPV